MAVVEGMYKTNKVVEAHSARYFLVFSDREESATFFRDKHLKFVDEPSPEMLSHLNVGRRIS